MRRNYPAFLIVMVMMMLSASSPRQSDNVEFVCHKIHKASNTCYFNFKVDGAKYTHVDPGCKKMKKKDEIVEKAKAGKIALAKDWKVDCPEAKR